MRKHTNQMRTLAASVLSTAMVLSMMPCSLLAQESDGSKDQNSDVQKTETVYSFINGDGQIETTTVSSWLHSDKGLNNVKETLDLTDVENVKGDEQPVVSGDTYTWSVAGDDLYYQGNTDKKPPVTVEITYELDGKKIRAAELEGKSGHLKTTVHFLNNESRQVTINGKKITIHPAFLAGGLLDLNHDVFSNIHCEQGKVVNDGDKEFLLFATVPGLSQTLESAGLDAFDKKTDLSDDIVIESDVKDFSVPALYIGASNELNLKEITDLDNMSDLTGKVQQLFDGADQIVDGASRLAEGMGQLKSGIAPLSGAGEKMTMLADGILALDNGSRQLKSGLQDYTAGVAQINAGHIQLYDITGGLDQVSEAINKKNGLKAGAKALSAGLGQLNTTVSGMDTTGIGQLKTQLDQAMEALKGLSAVLDKDIETMNGMASTLNDASSKAQMLAASLQSTLGSISKTVASDNALIASNNQKIEQANTALAGNKQAAKEAIAAAKNQADALRQANPDLDTSTLESSLDAAAAQIDAIAGVDSLETLAAMNPDDLTALQSALGGLQDLGKSLAGAINTMSSLKTDLDTSIQTLNGLKAKLDTLSSSDQISGLLKQLGALKVAVASLDAGGKTLSAGIDSLDAAVTKINTGAHGAFDKLNAGSKKLVESSPALNSGAKALSDGTAQMADSTSQLGELKTGLASLNSAVDQLYDGANQLKAGTQQFDEQGMGQLKKILGWTEEELQAFKDIVNESVRFNESFSSFAGAPEGAKTRVRYIFKVESDDKKDSKKSEEQPAEDAKEAEDND